jgi:F-type H+-transporting ATPase subunit delta
LSAAHRIYARALFEAAQEQGKLEQVHRQVNELRAAVEQVEELRALLENPEVDSRVKGEILARVAEGTDELVVNFAKLIAEKGRAAELAEIADELDALVAAAERILDVELITAHELSEQEFGRVVGRIEEASGRKVQATRSVDPELIGGLVLQAGSMRLDASVRGRLERLRHELATARS